MPHRRDDYIRTLSDDLIITETNHRILQEVSCCRDWEDVDDVLHEHWHYYVSLTPRAREYLNRSIKDLMAERLGG